MTVSSLSSLFSSYGATTSSSGRRKSCVGVGIAVPGSRRPKHSSKLFEYINEKQWNDVIELLNKKPNETKVWGEGILKVMKTKSLLNGNHHRDAHNQPKKHNKKTYVLPLHIALQQGAPIDVITKLVELFPKALQKKDSKFKRYPLHFACLYHPNNNVVKYIMEQYQQALWCSDILERLPIHYSCFNTKTQEQSNMVQTLLQNFPLGAQLTDKYGWIPLHIAIRNGTSFDTMKHLVGIFPSGLFVRTLKGSTSKDLALQCNNSSSNNGNDRTSEHVLNDLNVLESAALALLETSEIHSSFISIADALLAQRNSNTATNTTNEEDNAQLSSTALNRINEQEEEESSSSSLVVVDETATSATTSDPMNESSSIMNNDEPSIVIDTCVICLESYSTHIFVPCGHLCICQTCINDMEQSNKTRCSTASNNKCCPVCRKPSFMTLKVYAS